MSDSPTFSSPARFYLGVFLTCSSLMMLQIVETRLLSVVAHYHLAFFSISMAMFGMTAGAIWVYYRRQRPETDALPRTLSRLSAAFALSVAGAILLLVTQVPVLAMSFTTVLAWSQIAIILATPYFFAGAVVSLALTRSPFPIGRVYAADLVGASAGCLGALALLNLVDASSAMFAIGALAATAAITFASSRQGSFVQSEKWFLRLLDRPQLIVLALLAVCILNSSTLRGIQPIVVKNLVDRRDNVQYERWNSYSRILARKFATDVPMLWGPSSTLPLEITTKQVRLNIDGDAATSMFHFSGDPKSVDYLKYDLTNLAYTIRNSGRAAIIGVGGGRDVLSAWSFGYRDITGVELNPIFIDLLTQRSPFAEFAGLGSLQNVRFHIDDARSWFARTHDQFDIVQMSMIDTFAATGAGAFSLSENGLYTVEGWRHFIGRLTPTGVFTVSRWYGSGSINETGRMVSLATRALLDMGVQEPSRHLYMATTTNLATLILSRAPFTDADLNSLSQSVQDLKFSETITPARPPSVDILRQIVSSKNAVELQQRTSGQLLDLTPPTDDRPFFFNQLPLTHAYVALNRGMFDEPGVLSGNIIASATLMLILIIAILLVLATIVIPIRAAIRDANRRLVVSGSAYFLLIGIGFMFVEIALLQRLSVFLGHPIYSLSIVLFSIVLFTGIGSFISERYPLRSIASFGVWALAIGGYVISLPHWLPQPLAAFEPDDILRRATLVVALVAPAGLLMGFGFPTGMRFVVDQDSRPTPWFWGINGAGGVLGSVLAVACGITFGISTTMTIGGICYIALLPAAYFLGYSKRAGAGVLAQQRVSRGEALVSPP